MPVEAEVKQLLTDVVLITYDIPASESTLRHRFLRQVTQLGGMQYTASCYLFPYSEDILATANELESKGHAVVWVSKQPDKEKAIAITAKYEEHLKIRCLAVENRLAMLQDQIQAGRLKRAKKTAESILKMLDDLAVISETYSPSWFQPRLAKLAAALKEVYFGQDAAT